MQSQTTLVARKYRLQEWAAMIQSCQARPKNMTVDQWCEANSITTANYYYRFREVRKALLEQLPAETKSAVVPVPMELMTQADAPALDSESNTFVELVSNDITIRVTENTSVQLLEKVLGVIRHVK